MVLQVELNCVLVSLWSALVCVPNGGELVQQCPVTWLGSAVLRGMGTISTNKQAMLGACAGFALLQCLCPQKNIIKEAAD